MHMPWHECINMYMYVCVSLVINRFKVGYGVHVCVDSLPLPSVDSSLCVPGPTQVNQHVSLGSYTPTACGQRIGVGGREHVLFTCCIYIHVHVHVFKLTGRV